MLRCSVGALVAKLGPSTSSIQCNKLVVEVFVHHGAINMDININIRHKADIPIDDLIRSNQPTRIDLFQPSPNLIGHYLIGASDRGAPRLNQRFPQGPNSASACPALNHPELFILLTPSLLILQSSTNSQNDYPSAR